MKYMAFDIETAKVTDDGDNLNAERPLGISCWAAAWVDSSGRLSEPHVGYGKLPNGEPAPRMSRDECSALVDRLVTAQSRGFTIVTWNGAGFDFDILAEESGRHDVCADLALAHIDVMLQVFCLKGFPIGLDAVARGMGLQGKPEGMDGSKAPELWRDGQYTDVLNYVAQDVKTTLEIALEVEARRGLSWIARSGKQNVLPIPHLLTVERATRLPEPNTSWMDEPMPRSRFVGWIFEREARDARQ